MDLEKRARRESRRVIISETLMFVAVVVTVAILALLVSGYWFGSGFQLERQGMLQISSLPTGANIEIDGESAWMQRTNSSKVVSSGEHTVVLTKDGYDSWTKTVNVKEGLLYRLHYPRLFLLNRKKEAVLDTSEYLSASISPNRSLALLINNTTEWSLINLESDKIEPKNVDVSKAFSAVSLPADGTTGLFTGEIKSLNWANDNEHILFEVVSETGTEWVILNIKNPTEKMNLTREFGFIANFSEVKILNDSASSLLVVLNGNLHRVDVSNRQLSGVLVEKVHSFDHLDSEIIFSAEVTEKTEENADNYYVGILKLGENKKTTLMTTPALTKPVISKFYDEEYITILAENIATLYKKQNLEEILKFATSFAPEDIKVGHEGEFITLSSGSYLATLDMEANTIQQWSLPSEAFGWLDNDMIYSISEGVLTVYDFDGYNARELATNVSSHFPSAIVSDKWLYYFSDGSLIRETIRD